MKNFKIIIAALIVFAFVFSAFSKMPDTSIKGTIDPVDGGVKVTAVSKTDTFSSAVVNGMFNIDNVKPGLYNLIVEAKAPYKNASRADVAVVEGEIKDVGLIKLEK